MGGAGLAEMNLAVDHTRQNMKVAAIQNLGSSGRPQVPNGGNPARHHANVAQALTILVHHRAALEDQIKLLEHANSPILLAS